MRSSVLAELDLIEELRLRRWAREHYVPRSERRTSWHPVVHEEMSKKDHEAGQEEAAPRGTAGSAGGRDIDRLVCMGNRTELSGQASELLARAD